MPGKLRTVLLALAALAALAPAAHASVGSIYGDYTKDGSIDGCNYSPGDLNNAIGSIPTDVAQYDPRFKNALNDALGDNCGGGGGGSAQQGGGAGKQATAPDGSPKPAKLASTDVELAADTDLSEDRGVPPALLILGGLVAAILLGTLALAGFRRGGGPDGGGVLAEYYWGFRDRFGR
jgi:hypothetical protein